MEKAGPVAKRGTVYLLHFDRPFHHARHYLGFTTNLDTRLKTHRSANNNAKLMHAVHKAGIGFQLARTWPDVTRRFERRAHGLQLPLLCPLCDNPRWAQYGLPRESDFRDPGRPPLQVEPSWPEPEFHADPDYDFFIQDPVFGGPTFPPSADEPSSP